MKLFSFILLFILIAVCYALYVKSAFFTYHFGKKDVRIIRNVIYKEASANPKHTLDLYLPKNTENFPMVYFVHGGNWNSGDKRYYQTISGVYGNVGVALAQHGIGVAVANYRLHPEVGIEEEISDAASGITWMQEHASEYGAKQDLYVMGHSAGGHIAATLGTTQKLHEIYGIDEEKIKGYVVLSGVWDINEMAANSQDAYNAAVTSPLFGSTQQDRAKNSPLTYIENAKKPFFIAAGEYDYPYLKVQAQKVHEKLNERAVVSKVMIVPDASHSQVIIRFGDRNDMLAPAVLDFIKNI